MAKATNSANSDASSIGDSGGAWTQILRGVTEPIESVSPSSQSPNSIEPVAAPSGADEESGTEYGNGNAGCKRPAWNKQPSNGAAGLGPVMGAHSWPALSETTRVSSSSTKSSSDSLKGLADGSSSLVPQVTATISSSEKQVSNNGNLNSATNHAAPTRQKSMRRNNSHSSSNGGLPQAPAPQGSVVEVRSNNPSPRDQKSGFGSQFYGGNDHSHSRGSFKHRNGNSHPRGDGSHHHNYGGRHPDRGNQDWNSHRNYIARDAHMQPQRAVQRFTLDQSPQPPPPPPPPPSSAPIFPLPPVRPFGNPVGFPDFGSAVYYVAAAPPAALPGAPFIAPIPSHAVFFSAPDPQLHSRIVAQIDYYFSNENLVKDTFLRQNMDDLGWVPIRLIAGFNKVSLLTNNIQLILELVRGSSVVEVQGDRIRKRNDWMRWILPRGQFSNLPVPQPQEKSSIDTLSQHVESISLDQKTPNHSRSSSSGNLSNH